MSQRSVPRSGSLQYWPRKRARKFLPRVNWARITAQLQQKKGLLGSIAYKAGMASAVTKDNTANSITKDKRIIVPVTILECPPIKILSVRFYKWGVVHKEILNDISDKNLKRKIKLPKKTNAKEQIEKAGKELDYDDIKVIIYTLMDKTKLKKTPDLSEIAISGTLAEKLEFVKNNIGKEILFSEIFGKNSLVDVRGTTEGKGFQGPVKRFGISLRQHKSEKGRRRPGSLGPWHPSYVTFRAAMAGQLGFFTRLTANIKIIDVKTAREKPVEIGKYGKIMTEYAIARGSVQGPVKRQLLITAASRKTKRQDKKNFELINLRL